MDTKCSICKKNKAVRPGFYCSVCYRKNKKPKECERCKNIRPTIGGLCLSCYNYKTCGYRAEAVKKLRHICNNANCPMDYVPLYMLDVDHIDGNKKNSNIDNLQMLCVWCHALKTRKSYPQIHSENT